MAHSDEDATAGGTEAASEASMPRGPEAPGGARQGRAGRGWRRAIVGLLGLGVLCAATAGAGYLLLELRRVDASLSRELTDLHSGAAAREARLAALEKQVEGRPDSGARLERISGTLSALERQSAARQADLEAVAARVAQQREALERLQQGDRAGWVLFEAQALLRLAERRLQLAGGVEAARALLEQADAMLAGLRDMELQAVRAAIARDRSALDTAQRIDVQGIWARLEALREQALALDFYQAPTSAESAGQDEMQSATGEDRASGFLRALEKLSSYVVLRRREVDQGALLNPQWERLVRQNLALLLGQAQLALLAEDQTLYRGALNQAFSLLRDYPPVRGNVAQGLQRQIEALREQPVRPRVPDLSASKNALSRAVAAYRGLEDG